MKRKRQQQEERRRRTADLNMVDERKRLGVAGRGCGPFLGSVVIVLAAAALWVGPR